MRIHYLFLISFIVFSCPCWADTSKEDIVSSTIFDAVQRDNEKLKIRLQALEAEKAREKAESVELRLAREVDRSLWEHEKCQMLLQQIQIYFEKEKKNIQNHQKSEKDKREKYEQRLYNTSNIILFAISVLGGLLAVIIAVSALVGFRYFKNVKDEINKIKKEVINDAKDIKRQRENLYAHPNNDGTLDEKTVRQAQETSKNPNAENIIRSQAILYTNKKQWNEAYVFWKAVLEKEPSAPDAYFYIAISAYYIGSTSVLKNEKQKWWNIAIDNYRLCSKLDSNNPSVLMSWACALSAMALKADNKSEKLLYCQQAEEKFQQVTKLDMHMASAWIAWGILLSQCSKESCDNIEKENLYHQAEEKFHRAIELDANDGSAWLNWGLLLFENKYQVDKNNHKNFLDEVKSKFLKAKSLGNQEVYYYLAWLEALYNSTSSEIVKYLQAAKESGHLSLNDLKTNKDFDAIRDIPEFKAIIESLEQENGSKGKG